MKDGLILVYKRKGNTSRRVVENISKKYNTKAGHIGTLDPMAKGLLPVLVGNSCKLSKYLMEHDKTYLVEMKFGYHTETLDIEGNILEEEFDYLSFSTVRRTFDDLVNDGFLITGDYNKFGADRTKWYRVNKEKLKQLNAIIHPKVIDFYRELKEKNTDETIIFDVPLLFESGIDKFCDKILIVISDYEIQLNRIVERDKIDRDLAEKIIKSQLSNEERIKKADVVIENNSSLEDLFEKVERFCETI